MILGLPGNGKVRDPAILALDESFSVGVFEYQSAGFEAEAIGCELACRRFLVCRLKW
jgi:hypothetical protein